ncbi:hypothetical protein ACLMJK_006154 [Lecanora helva]
MPLEADDQRRVDEAIAEAEANASTKLLVRDASEHQKLGPVTVACTILNRTIGSGIYVTPAIILRSTGSVGISLLLWAFGAVVGMSALLVWLELGLSIPKFEIPDRALTQPQREDENAFQSVPRNGGEKNYLEYIYKAPKVRTTCSYGMIFIILGNLSGNAIAFGIYVMDAAGLERHDAAVRGLAVASMTVACLLHAVWRRGGILMNNFLTLVKVLTLTAIIIIGFSASAGASFGKGPVHGETVDLTSHQITSNFDTQSSFSSAKGGVANYVESILLVVYTYSGYEQPFYVLSEVSQPRKNFAKSTIAAMFLAAILFVLANVAYLCAVSVDQRLDRSLDMATLFFSEVFGTDAAPRVMSGILAFSILGNIVVMTFTASRVKQEIAKEGVLPFSLFFATSTTTPYAWLKERFWQSKLPESRKPLPEQSPAAALLLHWIFSMIMIGATSSRLPRVSYTLLVSLYSYSVVVMVGFFVAAGLLYLRYSEGKEWTNSAGFHPWGGPTAAIIYATVCAFILVAAWIPPTADSPFAHSQTGIYWYTVPTVGLVALSMGYLYYIGLHYIVPRMKKRVLVVEREAVLVKEKGEWVQAVELVEASWEARGPKNNTNFDTERITVSVKN